jgi:hypothetical protein
VRAMPRRATAPPGGNCTDRITEPENAMGIVCTWNSSCATLGRMWLGGFHHAYRLVMEPLNDDCSFAGYRITPVGAIIERACGF